MFCLQRTPNLVERTKKKKYIHIYYKPYLRNITGHNNFLSNGNILIRNKQSKMESEAKCRWLRVFQQKPIVMVAYDKYTVAALITA